MTAFQMWVKNSGYELTERFRYQKGNIEFTIDELAEIYGSI